MAIQTDGSGNKPVKTTSTGNAADTGTPVSLPPTRPVAPDEVSAVRAGTKPGLGMNGFAGASSDPPGTFSRSPLAQNIDATVGDKTLDAVRQFGSAAMRAPEVGDDVEDVKGTPATQIRKLAPGNVPNHPAMASARSRQPTK
jgi:hypothetical protein